MGAGVAAVSRTADLDLLARIHERSGVLLARAAADVERMGATWQTDGLDTADHLARELKTTSRKASGLVKDGQRLRPFEVLSDQAAQGGLTLGQAKAAAGQLADFPVDALGSKALEEAQRQLVEAAPTLDEKSLGAKAKELVDAALEATGEDPRARAEAAHRKAVRERHIFFREDDAQMRFGGSLPIGAGEAWRATLADLARRALKQPGGVEENPGGGKPSFAALMLDAQTGLVTQAGDLAPQGRASSPRPSQRRFGRAADPAKRGADSDPAPKPGAALDADAAGTATPAAPSAGSRTGSGGEPEDDELHGGGSSGGAGSSPPGRKTPTAKALPQVSVIVKAEDLALGAPDGVWAQTGAAAPILELARILCDCEAQAVILGAKGEVLDVGRAKRFVTPAIRAALEVRDGGCAFPNCDQPFSNTEAHHILPWWAGGTTSLDTLVSLCGRHHTLVEPARDIRAGTLPDPSGWEDPERWQVQINPIHNHPEFIPPKRLDPQRRPVTHPRIQLKLQRQEADLEAVASAT
jgi:hypothetical protein